MKEKIISTIKDSAIFLLMFMTIILIYTTIGWIIKIPITKYHLPVEFGITIVLFILWQFLKIKRKNKEEARENNNENTKDLTISISRISKENIIQSILSIVLATLIFITSAYIEGKIYDTTSDGNTYHKLAVGSMKNGWIPLYGSCKDYTEEDGNILTVNEGNINYLWADHYAIGTEIIGANIYAFSGNIETGKAYNIIMMYACFGIALGYLCLEKKLNVIKALVISFVLVANPITLVQWGTYYVDTALLTALFITLIELLSISKDKIENKRSLEKYFILAMSIAICANAKFTGLAYEAAFCGIFYLYWIIRLRKSKEQLKRNFIFDTVFYIITVGITVAVIGGSSYLMNTIKYKHPFYPLYGEGHVENMVNKEIPVSVSSKSYIGQFLTSIFSEGINVSPAYYPEGGIEPVSKVPFTFTKEELSRYCIPDIRMGGFGPLYSGIFIMTCIILVIMIIDFIKNKKIDELTQLLIIVVLSFLMITLLSGGYWARYIPYVYFISIMTLTYLLEKKNKIINTFGIIFALIFVANTLLVAKVSTKSYIENSRYVKKNFVQFEDYAKDKEYVEIELNSKSCQGVLYNIDDRGIKVKVQDEIEGKRDVFMFKY